MIYSNFLNNSNRNIHMYINIYKCYSRFHEHIFHYSLYKKSFRWVRKGESVVSYHKDWVHKGVVGHHNKDLWHLLDINIVHIYYQLKHIFLHYYDISFCMLLVWCIHNRDLHNPVDINKIHPLYDLIQYKLNHFDMVKPNKMFVEDIHINDLNNLVDKDIDHQHPIMVHMFLFNKFQFISTRKILLRIQTIISTWIFLTKRNTFFTKFSHISRFT